MNHAVLMLIVPEQDAERILRLSADSGKGYFARGWITDEALARGQGDDMLPRIGTKMGRILAREVRNARGLSLNDIGEVTA